jgi:hypothetical protein
VLIRLLSRTTSLRVGPRENNQADLYGEPGMEKSGRFQVKGLDLGPLFVDGQHDAVVRMSHVMLALGNTFFDRAYVWCKCL